MAINLTIQDMCDAEDIPSESALYKWICAAIKPREDNLGVCLRIVTPEEMQQLNFDYRQQDKPTNVLAFPFDMYQVQLDLPILGDLVVCADVIRQEAAEQHKKLSAHWAHMVIHGTLHLLGYDHQTEQQAAVMEQREIEILQEFGYDNPYEEKL